MRLWDSLIILHAIQVESQCRPVEFWSKAMSSAEDNHVLFKKPLLVYYGALVNRKLSPWGTKKLCN